PKDTDSLVATAATLGYDFAMLRAVVDVNRERAGHFVETMEKALNPMDGRVIAVLGLAFKPNTDDMREAKSIEVISGLRAAGAVFIGSHLCEFLLGRGCDVVGMDNFITGSPDNLAQFRDARGFALVQHDVTQHIELEGPLDWVLHFASPASPLDYLELPIQTLKVGAL